MVTIYVNNLKSKIDGLISEEINIKIYNACAYMLQGAEFSPKVLEGYWDGVMRLYSMKTQIFPTGLLSIVLQLLKENKTEYKIVDTRLKPNISTIPFNPPGPLRDYQEDAVQKALQASRGIIKIGTGGGKTTVIGGIVANTNVNTLIITHTSSVFNQVYNEFTHFFKVPIGKIGNGEIRPEKITVALIQSLTETVTKAARISKKQTKVTQVREELKDYLGGVQCMITDECVLSDSLIYTDKGDISASCLYDRIKQGEIINARCYNHEKRELTYKKISNAYQRDPKAYYKIKAGGLTLKCTGNHPVLTPIGYVPAEKLQCQDAVVTINKWGDYRDTFNYAIESIEYIENDSQNVYDFTVEDVHNFIVMSGDQGIIVHNCHHISTSTMQLVSDACTNAYYRIGVSATPKRDDNTDILIQASTGKQLVNYSASYLIARGYLAKPTIYLIENKLKRLAKGIKYKEAYGDRIVNNESRNAVITELASKHIENNNSVLISIQHLRHGELLLDILHKKYGDKVRFIQGSDEPTYVQQTLKDLDSKKFLCCIASSVLKEGVDVRGLEVLINSSAMDSSVAALQLAGRVLRKTNTKNRVVIYDIFDVNCRWFEQHSINRSEIYKMEQEFDIVFVPCTRG